MAQFFGTEDIKDLTKASQTTIDWTAGSYLRIGGQAYNVTSVLTLDLASDIDTGTVSSDTIYYIYAVVVAGIVSLKYSLSDTAPTGFAAFRQIEEFKTDVSAEISRVGEAPIITSAVGDIMQSMLTEAQFQIEAGLGWVLADGRAAAGTKYNTLTGNANIPDLRGRFLRGKNNGSTSNPDGDVALGTYTADAIRDIVGDFGIKSAESFASGPFQDVGGSLTNASGASGAGTRYRFTASRVVPTAADNRPKNVTVNIFIKIEDI